MVISNCPSGPVVYVLCVRLLINFKCMCKTFNYHFPTNYLQLKGGSSITRCCKSARAETCEVKGARYSSSLIFMSVVIGLFFYRQAS
jgi:hypothetical protein